MLSYCRCFHHCTSGRPFLWHVLSKRFINKDSSYSTETNHSMRWWLNCAPHWSELSTICIQETQLSLPRLSWIHCESDILLWKMVYHVWILIYCMLSMESMFPLMQRIGPAMIKANNRIHHLEDLKCWLTENLITMWVHYIYQSADQCLWTSGYKLSERSFISAVDRLSLSGSCKKNRQFFVFVIILCPRVRVTWSAVLKPDCSPPSSVTHTLPRVSTHTFVWEWFLHNHTTVTWRIQTWHRGLPSRYVFIHWRYSFKTARILSFKEQTPPSHARWMEPHQRKTMGLYDGPLYSLGRKSYTL